MTSDGRSYTRNSLNPFITTVKFWAPWKHQKTFGFLVFSGEAKRSIGKIRVKKNERNITERKERTPKTNNQPWRPPARYLLVLSQQWKHQNNAWNLFKVNNKDTRMTWMNTDFTHSSGSYVVNFEPVNAGWVAMLTHISPVFLYMIHRNKANKRGTVGWLGLKVTFKSKFHFVHV